MLQYIGTYTLHTLLLNIFLYYQLCYCFSVDTYLSKVSVLYFSILNVLCRSVIGNITNSNEYSVPTYILLLISELQDFVIYLKVISNIVINGRLITFVTDVDTLQIDWLMIINNNNNIIIRPYIIIYICNYY